MAPPTNTPEALLARLHTLLAGASGIIVIMLVRRKLSATQLTNVTAKLEEARGLLEDLNVRGDVKP